MSKSFYVVSSVLLLILFYVVIRHPTKTMRIIGKSVVRITIGLLLLFFFNVFGGYIGLHIPINVYTVAVSSLLGIFGTLALAAVQIYTM